MRRSPSLPSLLRTTSLIGVSAWLAWQLVDTGLGLVNATAGPRTIALSALILVGLVLGLRQLRRAENTAWRRMDAPLLLFALVLIAFEGFTAVQNKQTAERAVHIAPWSVAADSIAGAQLARALEAAWREMLWRQDEWQPVTWFATGSEVPPHTVLVQPSVNIRNARPGPEPEPEPGLEPGLEIELQLDGNGEAGAGNDSLAVRLRANSGQEGATLLRIAVDSLRSRFLSMPAAEPAAPATGTVLLEQARIDCALPGANASGTVLAALREQLYRAPDSASGHAAFAGCILQQLELMPDAEPGLRHEARASANRALVLEPDLVDAQMVAGMAAWNLDADPVRAAGLWRRALARFPRHAGLSLELASLLFSAGLAGAAMDEVDRALAVAPDHPRARYLQGLNALEQQDPVQAAALLEAAVAAAPDSFEYRLALAIACQRLDARGCLQELFPLAPPGRGDPDLLAYRSWALALAGDAAGAGALRDQLFEDSERPSGRAFRLALVAQGRGDSEAANRALLAARRTMDPRLTWPVNRLVFAASPDMLELAGDWRGALQAAATNNHSP